MNRIAGLSLLVGVAGWALLWFGTDTRAGWDSLVYHQFAFEYAGLAADDQAARSWELFSRYGSPDLVLYVTETLDGDLWRFDPGPEQNRWELQYRMRPAYPALVAAAYPLLGMRAPLAVSGVAVVLFVATTAVGLSLLAGPRVVVIATALGLVNPALDQWLVSLMTDGLAISLWAVTLTSGALWVAQGRWVWLLALTLAVLALSLARPLGVLSPAVFGLGTLAAGVARVDAWRPLAVATVVAAAPAAGVTILYAAAGFPDFMDLLQDLPTGHFTEPDIADPIGWVVNNGLYHLTTTMPVGLLSRPLVLLAVVGGIGGLWLAGRWWTAPFMAALPVVLVSHLLHPVTSELDRTLAPVWVSLHTGLALLVVVGAVRCRERILAIADRWTQPAAGSPR